MPTAIDDFLGGYSEKVSTLAEALRKSITATAADCTETLHPGWKVISYGYRKKFCAIAPHSRWVNLQFHAGSELEDPNDLLEGSGKSMRHARIEQSSDINKDLLKLVEQASEASQ